MVASVLMGCQQQGLALTDIPPLQFCIILGAGSPGSAFEVRCRRKASALMRYLQCCSVVHYISSLAAFPATLAELYKHLKCPHIFVHLH